MHHIANVSHRTEASSLLVQAFSAQPARLFTTESFVHILSPSFWPSFQVFRHQTDLEPSQFPTPRGLVGLSGLYPCRGSSNAKQSSSHFLKQRNHLYVPSIYHI